MSTEERVTLPNKSRGKTTLARPVILANIVFLAAESRQSKVTSADLGVPQKTASKWRYRFATDRLADINQDAPRNHAQASADDGLIYFFFG